MSIDKKYFPEFTQKMIDVGDGIAISRRVADKNE